MAPTLRTSTRDKTQASTDTARRAGFVRKTRPSLPRHKLYKRSKGLLNTKMTKARERIAIANATNSPLLRLPAEIRNIIFKLVAQHEEDDEGYTENAICLIYNKKGDTSASATSAYVSRHQSKSLAISLPRVCRQIYAETATIIYSENRFAFASSKSMERWLSKRLPAQREVITELLVPYFGGHEIEKALLLTARLLCPNLKVLREAHWLLDDNDLGVVCPCCRYDSFDVEGELSSEDSDGERFRVMLEEEAEAELDASDDW